MTMYNNNDHANYKYFLYARKSSESEDRQVQSIDDQVDRLKQLASNLGLTIKKVFTEAKSAKMPNNRPVFEEMMLRIEKGEADGILCWQINRLSRNPIDSGRIQWLLQKGILKSVQAIDKEYRPEDNVLLFSVESGSANQFILDLSKNVKRGIESKLQKGLAPFLGPVGYMNDKTKDRGERDIIPDPERFHLVRKMWDLMLTGNYTPPKILAIANNDWGFRTRKFKRMGGKELSNSGIYKIFGNPFYAGIIEWAGRQYEGKHQAMVTLEEFNHVQKLLGKAGRPRPQKHYFPFTGMIRCGECACFVTAETKQKVIKESGVIKTFTYYHCTRRKKSANCQQRYGLSVETMEAQIDSMLEPLTIAPEFLDLALEDIKTPLDDEVEKSQQIIEMQRQTLADLQKQLQNLTQLRLRDIIGDEEFLKDRKNLQDKITELQAELQKQETQGEYYMDLDRRAFNFAAYARIRFKDGSPEEQKEIFSSIGSNHTLFNKNLSVSVYPWLKPIIENAKSLESELRRLEPTKQLVNIAQNDAFTSLHTRWLPICSRSSNLFYGE